MASETKDTSERQPEAPDSLTVLRSAAVKAISQHHGLLRVRSLCQGAEKTHFPATRLLLLLQTESQLHSLDAVGSYG